MYLTFTYNIVYIKLTRQATAMILRDVFTYNIVYIKPQVI